MPFGPYNFYHIGTAVKVSCTFQVSSTDTDPTTITLEVTDPSGNTDTYTYHGDRHGESSSFVRLLNRTHRSLFPPSPIAFALKRSNGYRN